MEKIIRVLAADDHPVILLAVDLALSTHRNIELVSQATNVAGMIKELDARHHDVLITDFSMPAVDQVDGLSMLALLREHHPHLPIVVLTMLSNPILLQAMQKFDVRGIVSKADGMAHLAHAIVSADTGAAPYVSPMIEKLIGTEYGRNLPELTLRETEVLRLYAGGQTVSDIARQFRRSTKTISAQKQTAMRKLGLAGDADFVRFTQMPNRQDEPGDDF